MLRDEIKLIKAIAREIAQEEVAKALDEKPAPKETESLSPKEPPAAPAKIADDKGSKKLHKSAKKH